AEGLSLADLKAEFGAARVAHLTTSLTPYVQKGWVRCAEAPTPRLFLTDPEGFLFSNVVLVALFNAFSDPRHSP
ncbi:MAG: hypothetical protein F6K42_26820, partial [Leptolyngbya sp. SIO1D8]|nr:hypothetical protein [Leptolyngbya sp. SIO1D8]